MSTQNSIGTISKVYPDKVVIEVSDTTKVNHNHLGEFYVFEGVNSFITIYKSRFQKYIYQVVNLYEQEKPFINDEEISKFSNKAFFEAVPLGEINDDNFEFGLSSFPMIGNDVFLTLKEDINYILKLEAQDFSIRLGPMAGHDNLVPYFSIDNLFSHHMSILGNTGSGKSTTVRKLLHEVINLSDQKKIDNTQVNFVIFDVHDEYESLPDAYTNKINTDSISIPLETLTIEDWINLVQPSSAVQLPILMQGLRMSNLLEGNKVNIEWIKAFCALELYKNVQTDAVAKRSKIVGLLEYLPIEGIDEVISTYTQYGNFTRRTTDEKDFVHIIEEFILEKSQIPYNECNSKIKELMDSAECSVNTLSTLEVGLDIIFLFEEMKGNSQVRSYCLTLMTRIDNLIAVYAKNLFDDDITKKETFQESLKFEKGFTIFKCSDIEDSDLIFFTSYILRLIYKEQKDLRQIIGKPVQLFHFVFDEAHKYIIENKDQQNIISLKIFEKIAKEGRKFGIFMILASQRPSELSKTVLSQCNNFILHRIRNNVDIDQMRRSIPYITDSQLIRIAYLKTGSALFVGEAFSIPLEIVIDGKKYGEASESLKPSKSWAPPLGAGSDKDKG